MMGANNKTTLLDRFVLIEVAIFVTLGAMMGSIWYNFYVKPHDEARMELVECMEGNRDMSRSSYNTCVEKLRPR